MSLRFGDFPSIILTLDSVVRQRGSGHHLGGIRLDRSRAVAPADRPGTNSPLPFAAPDINQRHRPAIPVDGAPGFSGRFALQQALPQTRTQAAGDEGGCGGARSAARWRRQIWKILILVADAGRLMLAPIYYILVRWKICLRFGDFSFNIHADPAAR